MQIETINIQEAPVVTIVGERNHPRNEFTKVDVLECGHWLNVTPSENGHTERRCWKCLRYWDKDADEKNEDKLKEKRKMRCYVRAGVVATEDVLPHVVHRNANPQFHKREYCGHLVKMVSGRLNTFCESIKCVKCGVEGKFFAVERHRADKSFHLNLYALDDDGNEILMTKDHIIPVSKGGKNHSTNYQTMCCICNEEKADTID